MSKYEIQIGDEVREMTADEIAQREKDISEIKAFEKAQSDRVKLKAATLEKLGLTADEVSALLS